MDQQEYEKHIDRIRTLILNGIEAIEEACEEACKLVRETGNTKMLESLLQLLLLVAHKKEGKELFINLLNYAGKVNEELANKYWDVYDDIENLVKNKYFHIVIE
ncbi:hypothetical protein HR17_01190 [Porphyromonas gulae]|uniref:hypothetical protein n=1 Tax=Porphyromonas gulae TaxID=111105 RepID=UPI00052DEB97|nr:hypothetical protein [Porphyromonas gulae]KGN77285.1 hypothetical protein HR17_01190 [Porphyromonas gulae]